MHGRRGEGGGGAFGVDAAPEDDRAICGRGDVWCLQATRPAARRRRRRCCRARTQTTMMASSVRSSRAPEKAVRDADKDGHDVGEDGDYWSA